jgi:hypothetical protein
VIVGGMSFGTVFTLFVVPVVYLLLSGKHETVEAAEPIASENLVAAEGGAGS